MICKKQKTNNTSHHISSHLMTSHLITSHHISSHLITSHHISLPLFPNQTRTKDNSKNNPQ